MYKKLFLTSALVLTATTAFGADMGLMDTNGDGQVSNDEYYGSVSDWGTYSDWDTNSDGFVSETEFSDGPFDGTFSDYDVNDDGYLNTNEVYDGIYTTYDADSDGFLNDSEYTNFYDAGYMG